MPKQRVPDIDFEHWVLCEIPELITSGKIYINKAYQRGDIWTDKQKVDLIRSIDSSYSIGVIVLFVNDEGHYEILDGQQRLLAIEHYLEDKMDLTNNTDVPLYSSRKLKDKTLLDAYCVYYIKLKSHNQESKEEDIVQTFLRLQEGTPLNKAEKLNAHRGKFKDLFRETRETHPVFKYLENERRFRFRQLAAELLALELESDFAHRVFPNLDLPSMIGIVKKYEENISSKKITAFKGNLDYLNRSLNFILTAFKPGELVSFYLLISYLRKFKADNADLINEFSEFAKEFLKNLSLFSIYDKKPPKGMTKDLFEKYRGYKLEAKVMTTPESIRKRFDIILGEFERLHPIIIKDPTRLHDVEQKRILYFRQKGLCAKCGKTMIFSLTSSHHVIAHSGGGVTDDLSEAALLHQKCHEQVEREIKKGMQAQLPFSGV